MPVRLSSVDCWSDVLRDLLRLVGVGEALHRLVAADAARGEEVDQPAGLGDVLEALPLGRLRSLVERRPGLAWKPWISGVKLAHAWLASGWNAAGSPQRTSIAIVRSTGSRIRLRIS